MATQTQTRFDPVVTENDLDAINKELQKGNDVRIQTTSYGIRIISDEVSVVKKVIVSR